LSGLDVELVEHHGDDDRFRGAAQRGTVAPALGDDSAVVVRLIERGVGDEHMPRDSPHCVGDAMRAPPAAREDAVDHQRPQRLG
jgi:hypothetical protein